MNIIGGESKTTFLKTEEHKLTEEFVSSAIIKSGQPVKLGTDGKVAIWLKGDDPSLCIGYTYNDVIVGGNVTVFVKGFLVVFCLSAAAQNAGLVTVGTYDSATDAGGGRIGYNKVAAVGANEFPIGWALDAATAANQLVRVLYQY